MGPIEALLFRLRQAARLADAERRLDALQAAQGAAQQAAPAAADLQHQQHGGIAVQDQTERPQAAG